MHKIKNQNKYIQNRISVQKFRTSSCHPLFSNVFNAICLLFLFHISINILFCFWATHYQGLLFCFLICLTTATTTTTTAHFNYPSSLTSNLIISNWQFDNISILNLFSILINYSFGLLRWRVSNWERFFDYFSFRRNNNIDN